jgi:hypothetical protein
MSMLKLVEVPPPTEDATGQMARYGITRVPVSLSIWTLTSADLYRVRNAREPVRQPDQARSKHNRLARQGRNLTVVTTQWNRGRR